MNKEVKGKGFEPYVCFGLSACVRMFVARLCTGDADADADDAGDGDGGDDRNALYINFAGTLEN